MKKTIKGKVSKKKDEKRMIKLVRTGIKAGECGGPEGGWTRGGDVPFDRPFDYGN